MADAFPPLRSGRGGRCRPERPGRAVASWGAGSGTELPAGREEEGWAPPPAPDKGPGGARPGPMAIPMVPMETQLQSIFEEVVVSLSPERRRCRASVVGGPAARPGPRGPPCSLWGGGWAILKEREAGGRGAFGSPGAVGAVEPRRPPRPCSALFPAAAPGGAMGEGGSAGLESTGLHRDAGTEQDWA